MAPKPLFDVFDLLSDASDIDSANHVRRTPPTMPVANYCSPFLSKPGGISLCDVHGLVSGMWARSVEFDLVSVQMFNLDSDLDSAPSVPGAPLSQPQQW